MRTIADTARAWATMYALALRAWPFGAVARPAMVVVTFMASGVIPAVALQQILQAAALRESARAVAWMALLAVAVLSRGVISGLWTYVQAGLMWRTNQAMTDAMMRASLGCAGIDHLENPAYADHMETVRRQAHRAGLLVDFLASAVGTAVTLTVAIVILVRVQPLLAVPVSIAAMASVAGMRTRRRALDFMAQAIPGQRLARRLAQLATSRAAAEETRSLDLSPWLVERHKAVTADVARRIVRSERGPVGMAILGAFVEALMLATGITILTLTTSRGAASVANLALGIVLLQSTLMHAAGLGYMSADLATNTFAARRLLWLLRYRPAVVVPASPSPLPESLRSGIVFDDVSFVYPGDERPALDGVTLTLRAGTTVALVGDNGAGKTTLVSCSAASTTRAQDESSLKTRISASSTSTRGMLRAPAASRTSCAFTLWLGRRSASVTCPSPGISPVFAERHASVVRIQCSSGCPMATRRSWGRSSAEASSSRPASGRRWHSHAA